MIFSQKEETVRGRLTVVSHWIIIYAEQINKCLIVNSIGTARYIMEKEQKNIIIRIAVTAVMLIVLNFLPITGIVRLLLFIAAYLVIGYDILIEAGEGIIKGEVFDEDFLMAIASVGAIALAAWQGDGDYNEAVMVMLLFRIGELFEDMAVEKSRENISELMDIRPDSANLVKDGKTVKVSPADVEVGEIIAVNPGEKVPLDGVIVEGTSTLNTVALTGESLPRECGLGDEVMSGCVNMTGVIKVKTTKPFGESAVSKILALVEDSGSRKAKSENFITKFAAVYTPAVCIGALLLAVIPPVIGIISGNGANWAEWIYRALTFLVISCPCALVISIPLSFFAGIGGASREGILIKGANFIETLADTKIAVFDKTGTLTRGVFEVNGIHHNKLEDEELLEYAALAESASSHPISVSLRAACAKKLDASRVSRITEIGGEGVEAVVDGKKIAVGNAKLMKRIGCDAIECHKNGTIVHVAIDGEYMGHILISDTVKPTSKNAIEALKRGGVRETVMLTGDSAGAAEEIAREVGVDKVYSELLPADKVTKVEELITGKKDGEQLAFVGDGINDAPVLCRADIGIAMGGIGSDAAIEAADVVLMDDDPMKLYRGIRISKKCLRIVKENIVFALAVKLICLILGATGHANMWVAIFADVGVMVIAVLNAIRAMHTSSIK